MGRGERVEFLIELLFEILVQILLQVGAELGLESVGNSFMGRRSANPWLSALGMVILGALLGFASSWVLPRRITPAFGFTGISIFLGPLFAGLAMYLYGSWRKSRGGNPTYLATFWGGGLFALAMSVVRWHMVGRG